MRAAVAVGALAWAGAAVGDPAPLAAPTLLPERTAAAALALEGRLDASYLDLAADGWYGLSPRLTVGLRTSWRGADTIGAGRGVCVRGCLAGDPRVRGLALTARFPVVTGRTRVAGELATDVTGWSPAHAAVGLGAIADWGGGPVAVRASARLAIGLLGRTDGNRDRARVDVAVVAPVMAPVAIEVGAGVTGPATDGFFAGATAPAWLQLAVAPAPAAGVAWGVGLAIGTDDVVRGERTGYAALVVTARR